jgi:hypothetical protein
MASESTRLERLYEALAIAKRVGNTAMANNIQAAIKAELNKKY